MRTSRFGRVALHAAIRGLARLPKKQGVRLRQSYLRIGKWAAMMAGRYAHAKQFNRHRRQLRILRVRLGRLIRDIRRKIAGDEQLEEVFAWPLSRADQIRHAPEVECIGKSVGCSASSNASSGAAPRSSP